MGHASQSLEAGLLLAGQPRELTLESALEEFGRSKTGGVGRFQWRMVGVCGLAVKTASC